MNSLQLGLSVLARVGVSKVTVVGEGLFRQDPDGQGKDLDVFSDTRV